MKTLLFIAWIGAYSTDMGTTHYLLSRGATEYNPLLSQNANTTTAVLGAEAVSGLVLANKFYASRPKLTKTLLIIGIAADGYCGIHNIVNIRRSPR